MIEDQLSRVMAYSNLDQSVDEVRSQTILGRRLPDRLRRVLVERGVFRHLSRSDEPLFIPPSEPDGLVGRMVVAVRAGRELLGSLWVETDQALTGPRLQVLEDGARTVALHLLRSRASADLERQVESDLVTRLLEGTGDAAAMLSQRGLPSKSFRVVALQAHVGDERHAGVLLAFEHATTGFGWSRKGRSALFANTVYTLLPSEDGDPQRARGWVESARAEMPDHVEVLTGIGAPAKANELPASRQEADECLAMHAAHPSSPPVAYDESWDQILLQRLRGVAASGRVPTRGPVSDLRRHDTKNGTRYIETLRIWLRVQGDVAVAAAALNLHPNTIRYRLRRMNEITALGLERPDQRLAMLIELAAAG